MAVNILSCSEDKCGENSQGYSCDVAIEEMQKT